MTSIIPLRGECSICGGTVLLLTHRCCITGMRVGRCCITATRYAEAELFRLVSEEDSGYRHPTLAESDELRA